MNSIRQIQALNQRELDNGMHVSSNCRYLCIAYLEAYRYG